MLAIRFVALSLLLLLFRSTGPRLGLVCFERDSSEAIKLRACPRARSGVWVPGGLYNAVLAFACVFLRSLAVAVAVPHRQNLPCQRQLLFLSLFHHNALPSSFLTTVPVR